MNKAVGILLVLLGIYFVFKMLLSGWVLFLILSAIFAWATYAGKIGRWGYVPAALLGLLALPALLMKTMSMAFGMLFRLAPVLLVVFGVYLLLKSIRK